MKGKTSLGNIRNFFTNPVVQAVGQMITDDWVPAADDEWDPFATDSDWRFTGVPPTRDTPAAVDDSNPIDIEGTPSSA